jgi:hypothetical protein
MHSRRRRPARPGCGTSKHTQVEPRAAIPGVDRHPHARRTLSHRPLHAVADEQVIPADPCRGAALELQSLSFLKIRTMLLLSISGDDDSEMMSSCMEVNAVQQLNYRTTAVGLVLY